MKHTMYVCKHHFYDWGCNYEDYDAYIVRGIDNCVVCGKITNFVVFWLDETKDLPSQLAFYAD